MCKGNSFIYVLQPQNVSIKYMDVCLFIFGSWIWHTISVPVMTRAYICKRPAIHKWNESVFCYSVQCVLHFIQCYLPCLRSTAIIVGMKIQPNVLCLGACAVQQTNVLACALTVHDKSFMI